MDWTAWCSNAVEQFGQAKTWTELEEAVQGATNDQVDDPTTFDEFMQFLKMYDYPTAQEAFVSLVVSVACRMGWPDPYFNTQWSVPAIDDYGAIYVWDGTDWQPQANAPDDGAWQELLTDFRCRWNGEPETWHQDVLMPLGELARTQGMMQFFNEFAGWDRSYAVGYLQQVNPSVFSGNDAGEPGIGYEKLIGIARSAGTSQEDARKLVSILVAHEVSKRKALTDV